MQVVNQLLVLLVALFRWNTASAVSDAAAMAQQLALPWYLKIPGVLSMAVQGLVSTVENELKKLDALYPVAIPVIADAASICDVIEHAIVVAEGAGGTGAAKKQAALDGIKGILALLPLPGYLTTFLTDDVLSTLIDLAVAFANREGFFLHSGGGATSAPPAAPELATAPSGG